MRFYAHIVLPKKLQKQIKAIEKKYKVTSKSEPHITVIPPREMFKNKRKKELVKAFEAAAKNLRPFLLYQKGVHYFGRKSVIYIEIAKTPEWIKCHSTFMRTVKKFLKPFLTSYADDPQPHITIIKGLSHSEQKSAWQDLKDKNFCEKLICRKIALWEKNDYKNDWHLVGIFTLV